MRTMELGTRFPNEYEAWEKRRVEIEKRIQKTIKQQQEEFHETFKNESGDLQLKVRDAVIDEILKAFPLALTAHLRPSLSVLTFCVTSMSFRALRRDGFLHGLTSAAPVKSIPVASGGTAGKPDKSYITRFSRGIGTLYDLFTIYPEAKIPFLDAMSPENIDNGIKESDFHFKKKRLLILVYLLKNYPNLTTQQTRSLSDAVLDSKDDQNALNLLKSFSEGEKTMWHSMLWRGRDVAVTKEEAEVMWKSANDYATSLSYSRFLSYVLAFPATNYLHDAAVKSEEAAYTCLRTYLDSQVTAISQKILSIQKEESNKRIRLEVENEVQEELRDSRIEFVRKIEVLCREHPGS